MDNEQQGNEPEEIQPINPQPIEEPSPQEEQCGRVTVVENVYYQKCPTSQTTEISNKYQHKTVVKEPCYHRPGIKVGLEDQRLDLGFLKDQAGTVIIKNTTLEHRQRILSQEQEKEIENHKLILTFMDSTMGIDIYRGRTQRIQSTDLDQLYIRSILIPGEYEIWVIPE